MINPNLPENEAERLAALYSYDLLNKGEQKEFKAIVELASEICKTPMSIITLVDTDKQWFKANVGMNVKFTERNIAFCAHTINTPHQPLIVKDATKDERFEGNPLVTGDPNIVFYAGYPLVTNDGHGLGTLCVIDREPRELKETTHKLLDALSQQVVRLFELRKTVKALEEKENLLEQTTKALEHYNSIVGQDLKKSFRSIEVSTELLHKINQNDLDPNSVTHLQNIQKESTESIRLINDMEKNGLNL